MTFFLAATKCLLYDRCCIHKHDLTASSHPLFTSHFSIKLINGEAGSHVQVTATVTSVLLCPAFSSFGKRFPMPENAEEKPGKEHLGHAEVMLVSGT